MVGNNWGFQADEGYSSPDGTYMGKNYVMMDDRRHMDPSILEMLLVLKYKIDLTSLSTKNNTGRANPRLVEIVNRNADSDTIMEIRRIWTLNV